MHLYQPFLNSILFFSEPESLPLFFLVQHFTRRSECLCRQKDFTSRKHHALHDAELDTLVTGVDSLLPIDCPRKKERMEHAQRPLLFHSKELDQSPDSHSTVDYLHHPFLVFDENSVLSFLDESRIYCSLVALVKADYPFDNVLQDRAVQFLRSLTPIGIGTDHFAKLVTDLVPSSDGSPYGFVDSVATLLSSPHSTVVAAALRFLYETLLYSSLTVRCRLIESGLISKVLAILQHHTVQISGNEKIIDTLMQTFYSCIKLAFPSSLIDIGITATADQFNHREMIFQKVVIPSSQFVTFLISNRNMLNGSSLDSFMKLLNTHLRICPFHRPTLEFVIASPIAMTITSCLSTIENRGHLWYSLIDIEHSLEIWTTEGQEVVQSGKRMVQALISEGFVDTLEQMMMNTKDGAYGHSLIEDCMQISNVLGSNVEFTEHEYKQLQTALLIHMGLLCMLDRQGWSNLWRNSFRPFDTCMLSRSKWTESEPQTATRNRISWTVKHRPVEVASSSPTTGLLFGSKSGS
ncbi:hypothetical protein BLNAU_23312 [Blattamonas nauphoetae]|uniref:Uncharacterized protein n=1 Tax=Blattamonas nauphoetae TaxID=2049346 RepID=A0ABQ9WQL4_9EUKA|nr:hypothetical protein BLNAU_23312 [Blattamonas nauphoetae]